MLAAGYGSSQDQLEAYVIEDDPDHQTIARLALRSAGIEKITCFATGEEAIAFFESSSPAPQASRVILIDLMLPAIGGLELLQRLRNHKRWGSSTMVVLTCSTSEEDRAKSREYGADRFCSKPLRRETVDDIISSLR